MIAGIREFITFATIEDQTAQVVDEQKYREDRIAYEQNFLIPYLSSDTARYFFEHENSVLFQDEYIVVFNDEKDEENIVIEAIDDAVFDEQEQLDRKQSWDQFVDGLLEDI